MNSKFLILIVLLIFITGCGVKADPVKYSETVIDSYVQNYTGKEAPAEDLEQVKKQEPETKSPPLTPIR